jgi:hypothetical protein
MFMDLPVLGHSQAISLQEQPQPSPPSPEDYDQSEEHADDYYIGQYC